MTISEPPQLTPEVSPEHISQPQKEASKSNPIRKIILAITGLAILVGIAGGSYYLGTKQASQSRTSIQDTQPTLTQKTNVQLTEQNTQILQTVTPTIDPTPGWLTYTNAKYGYSIKYPQGFSSNEVNTYHHYVEFKYSTASGQLPAYLVSVIPDTFVVKDVAAYNYMSADWINNISIMTIGETKTMDAAATFTRLKDMSINGQDAVSIKVQARGFSQVRTYIKKNGYIYMIANYYQNPETAMEDYSLFASSFKITQ